MPNYPHSTKLSLNSGEEPPYLTVGTDVSAKYKGAFCEAKITDVNKHVKLRVIFDGSNGTYLIDDTDLKAGCLLENGTRVEAKHPEKKQQTYVQATITKILDHSRYTVVFDDGDQCILRRNSLCLKSGKHFAESETLDQLPLTNPEHFGNPVKVGASEQPSNPNPHLTSVSKTQTNNQLSNDKPRGKASSMGTNPSGGCRRSLTKGRKRRESVNSGTRHSNELEDNSADSAPDSAEASVDETINYDSIEVGVKLMVQYGKGVVQNVYEAKVNKIEINSAGKTRYFVHYTGWNNRYDEWITRNRILKIVTEKENGFKEGRSKNSEASSTTITTTPSSLVSTAAAPTSLSTSTTCSSAVRDKEKDKEKDRDSSLKTRRARQSEFAAIINSNPSEASKLSMTISTTPVSAIASSTTCPSGSITTTSTAKEKEKERDRDRDKEKDKEKEKEKERDKETEKEKERDKDKEKERVKDREISLKTRRARQCEIASTTNTVPAETSKPSVPVNTAADPVSTVTQAPCQPNLASVGSNTKEKEREKCKERETTPKTRRSRQIDTTPAASIVPTEVLKTQSKVSKAQAKTNAPSTACEISTRVAEPAIKEEEVKKEAYWKKDVNGGISSEAKSTKQPEVALTPPTTLESVAAVTPQTLPPVVEQTISSAAITTTTIPQSSPQTLEQRCGREPSTESLVPLKSRRTEQTEVDELINSCVDIDEPDCDRKISILQDRIMSLRQTYMSLKTELADLDRRRKRPRTDRSSSEHINCGLICRN